VSTFFIIDTNVVVAGLLTAHADSPVARILDGMLSATFAFVVSEALLAEYRTVLLRPKLCKLHGLTEPEVDTLLTDIARHAIVLAPSNGSKVTPNAPDPGDQFLWELLNTRTDLVLVTGDKLLLADLAMQQRVILPQAFIAQLTH
jgi:putative PIN family toxin of toxin-antitoxin system